MAIRGVSHVGLTVADADRSIAFYCDSFGFELLTDRVAERGWVEQGTGVENLRLRIVHLRGHGWQLELLEYERPRGAARARAFNDAGSAHLCFMTDDIDADVERLVANGAERINPPAVVVGGPHEGSRMTYLKDPDGNAVELHQRELPEPA